MKLAKEEVAKRLAEATCSTHKKNQADGAGGGGDCSSSSTNSVKGERKYKVGDFCRSTYEDGIDYEAKILAQDPINRKFLIKYIGYDNEDYVDSSDLLPSWGKRQRKQQKIAASIDKDQEVAGTTAEQLRLGEMLFDRNKEASTASGNINAQPKLKKSSKVDPSMNLMFPPPPPMPPMVSDDDMGDAEHLSAMLMSWYMSGYYTGLYQGQKLAQRKTQPQ